MSPEPPAIPDIPGVDDLYALDPSEFTKARNALAAQVRKSGDRESSDAIKKLSRPAAVAAALNRIARERSAEIDELLELGHKVRDAQAKALEGGDPDALRDATAARRIAIRDLAGAAAEIAGESHRAEAAATLEAATMDGDAGATLRAGRLSRALEPRSDFGLAHMSDAGAGAAPRGPDRQQVRRLEQEIERAAAALADAEQAVEEAERKVADAQRTLQRAQAEAIEARNEHKAAVAALEAAQP